MKTRIEKDLLGTLEIDDSRYWGINTERAKTNFAISKLKTPEKLIIAMAQVKKACAVANHELGYLNPDVFNPIVQACDEIFEGGLFSAFPLDALQGGAGTSTNMNINEVIANRALEISGRQKGDYSFIDPIETVNLHQSTNDVYPTALKIAAINLFRELSNSISMLQGSFQQKEKEFRDFLMLGRTEMQDAVPMTLGAQFASFADCVARDRWRTFKCEERLRIVNIGGTAIGTGLTAPRNYIFLVIEKLRNITGLGLSRAEQVMDATANTDAFVEVFGMLNANASNLIKIANDLRFMHYQQEINLAAVQAGSSIMPGKVNPVICEMVISASLKVLSNSELINQCSSRGSNQINEFMPLIALSLLESLEILTELNKKFAEHVMQISADEEILLQRFNSNTVIITAFLPYIGYGKAETLVHDFQRSGQSDFRNFLSDTLGEDMVNKVLSPGNLMSLGYRKEKD